MSPKQTRWVVLAHLLRPQGRRGEVLADLLTDFPNRFEPQAKVFLLPSGFDRELPDATEFEIASSWLPHGRNAGRIVLGFRGVGSIEDAERVAGLDVAVPATDRLPLTKDSVYIDDLIGCTLFDRGVPVGTVRDVQFMTTNDGKRRLDDMAPLLTIEVNEGEALIPFAKDFLIALDVAARELRMNLPEGLVKLNLDRASSASKSVTRGRSKRSDKPEIIAGHG